MKLYYEQEFFTKYFYRSLAYFASFQFDVSFLIPFAAGNFIYIAASDLVPDINKNESIAVNIVHFVSFIFGLGLMLVAKFILE